MNNQTSFTALNHARVKLEQLSSLCSSKKGFAMKQIAQSFAKIFVLGFALTLVSCGQVPEVIAPAAPQAIPKASSVQSRALDTSSGLVGYWSFDTDNKDHSSSGNNATIHAGMGNIADPAPTGEANTGALASFKRPASFATASGNVVDDLNALTISFWVRINSTENTQNSSLLSTRKVQFSYTHAGGHAFLYFNVVGSGTLSLHYSQLDSQVYNLADGAYHQVVGTYDGQGNARAFIDGVQMDGGYMNGSPLQPSGITFGDPNSPFAGRLDDVQIYNREFAPKDVLDWYVCGRGLDIPLSECQALTTFGQTIYFLNPPTSANFSSNGWLRSNTPCKWFGVWCQNGHVYGLAVPSQNLSIWRYAVNRLSPFPTALGDLTQLQLLDLRNNNFAGPIPEDWGTIPTLKVLAIGGNQFSGSIPDSFSQLGNLETLDLSRNLLGGDIPNELDRLTKLSTLDLSDNQFSGSIPVTLGSLTKLTTLNLQNNQLRGAIPSSLGNSGATMNLGYNRLNANDPNLIAALKTQALDWDKTQTVPVSNLQAKAASSSSIRLTWNPVRYTTDGGYYDILMMPAGGSTFTSVGHTTDKSSSSFTVPSLTSGQAYSFVVRTITPKHGEQQNDLSSDASDPVVSKPTIANRAPVAVNDSYVVIQNTPLTVTAARGIFANDSDADGDPLRIVSVSSTALGSKLSLKRDGSFTFSPPVNFFGTATYSYQISDGSLLSNTATISFQVTPPAPGSVMAFVYQDLNVNHDFDYYEQMLSGWQIVLKNTQTGQAQTLTSDARGLAYFTKLAPGAYSVCETIMSGWIGTSLGTSAGCYTVNVVSGQNATFWFGNTTGF